MKELTRAVILAALLTGCGPTGDGLSGFDEDTGAVEGGGSSPTSPGGDDTGDVDDSGDGAPDDAGDGEAPGDDGVDDPEDDPAGDDDGVDDPEDDPAGDDPEDEAGDAPEEDGDGAEEVPDDAPEEDGVYEGTVDLALAFYDASGALLDVDECVGEVTFEVDGAFVEGEGWCVFTAYKNVFGLTFEAAIEGGVIEEGALEIVFNGEAFAGRWGGSVGRGALSAWLDDGFTYHPGASYETVITYTGSTSAVR